MERRKYTTKSMLRCAVYCAIVAVIVLPFVLASFQVFEDGTVDNLLKIMFLLIFGGALLCAVIYLIYYLVTRKYTVVLDDEGVHISNCAFRVEGARREPIDNIVIKWDEIDSLQDRLTTPLIYLKSGEKIGIRDRGEVIFGRKVWKDIAVRLAK